MSLSLSSLFPWTRHVIPFSSCADAASEAPSSDAPAQRPRLLIQTYIDKTQEPLVGEPPSARVSV